MDTKKIKMQLVDLTEKIWRQRESDTEIVWDWIHPDGPDGPSADGVYCKLDNDTLLLEVYTETGIKVYEADPLKLTKAVGIAVDYAQMAGITDPEWNANYTTNLYAGTRIVEALDLAGHYDAGFTADQTGVSWWIDEYLVEYSLLDDVFTAWWRGNYWNAGSAEAYKAMFEKAAKDRELWEFVALKREVENPL
jgi:hypothetical protein